MTRIRPNTMSDDKRRTGIASSTRRITYLYISRLLARSRSSAPAAVPAAHSWGAWGAPGAPHGHLSSQVRAIVGDPYPSVSLSARADAFRTSGWTRRKALSYGLHLRNT